MEPNLKTPFRVMYWSIIVMLAMYIAILSTPSGEPLWPPVFVSFVCFGIATAAFLTFSRRVKR